MALCSSSTFDFLLLNQQFRSYASLMEAFARYETNNLVLFFRYQEENKVVLVIMTSKRCDNRALRYSKLYLGCYKRKRKSTTTRGLRRLKYVETIFILQCSSCDTNCPARICFVKRKNALMVSSFKLEHNHDCTELAYRRHPRNRCLSAKEIDECPMLFH